MVLAGAHSLLLNIYLCTLFEGFHMILFSEVMFISAARNKLFINFKMEGPLTDKGIELFFPHNIICDEIMLKSRVVSWPVFFSSFELSKDSMSNHCCALSSSTNVVTSIIWSNNLLCSYYSSMDAFSLVNNQCL